MMTTKGEIPSRLLRCATIEEHIPCGVCVTTQYFDMKGDLVREDVEIKVDKAALLAGLTGGISA